MRRIVLINQAVNYLTIGFANAFSERMDDVALITGSVHAQGEELNGSIHVSWINRWFDRPASKKALSYILALVRIWWLLVTKYRKYEVLFVSVPPMAYLLNLIVPNRFSMIIWDVYPDVLKVAKVRETSWIYRIWEKLNRSSFRKAYRFFTISETMADSLERYVSRERIIIHPIWSIFQTNSRISDESNPFVRKNGLEGKFVVQYSGNIGATHNVEVLLEVAAHFEQSEELLFQIIGRGTRHVAIRKMAQEAQLANVSILPFQSDADFPYSLSAASLGVVVLDERVDQGSVPSKAYNLMSFGIPSLYIASPKSELAKYARQYKHAKCFTSDQMSEIVSYIRRLSTDRDYYTSMHSNALVAAERFKRVNADRFVASYLE